MNSIFFEHPFNYDLDVDIVLDEESKNDEMYNDDLKPIYSKERTDDYKNNEYTTKETANKEQINIFNEIKQEQEELNKPKELNNSLNVSNSDSIKINVPSKIKNSNKEISPLRKKRGRSVKTREHDKYSDDNLRRKVKHLTLNNLFSFINDKINEKYQNNIGYGIFIKKLLTINQKQKSDLTIQFDKDFLNKSLGDIFSENISTRYNNFPLTHNKSLIQFLINEKENDKRNYFTNLFNLRFIDALRHFRGSQEIEELKGLNGFNSIKTEFEADKDYMNLLEYYIMNYENILDRKRQKQKKEINKK